MRKHLLSYLVQAFKSYWLYRREEGERLESFLGALAALQRRTPADPVVVRATSAGGKASVNNSGHSATDDRYETHEVA